jgi:hypothetical protein
LKIGLKPNFINTVQNYSQAKHYKKRTKHFQPGFDQYSSCLYLTPIARLFMFEYSRSDTDAFSFSLEVFLYQEKLHASIYKLSCLHEWPFDEIYNFAFMLLEC